MTMNALAEMLNSVSADTALGVLMVVVGVATLFFLCESPALFIERWWSRKERRDRR